MESTRFHDIFDQYFHGMRLSRALPGRTERMPLSEPVGDGVIRRLVTRSSMEIVLSDFRLLKDRTIQVASGGAMVELSFCLQGKGEVSVSGERHELAAGSCALQFMQGFRASFEYDKRDPVRSLAIGIPVSLFNDFMADESEGRSVNFAGLIGGGAFRKFQKPIDPRASYIISQMLERTDRAPARKLYMESKALELLSIYFETFLFDREQQTRKARLSKSDLDKVRQAGEILLGRMDCPPSLLELSRMVRLNDFKLKIGFKEMYGTTVFGYLRDNRLEQAMTLLQNGAANVSRAASIVGYANVSHFSESFRGKFGINPSEFIRRRAELD
ncbi:AraC-type DNA-binding protein [Paenibacillus tianmuensis]|uniref:AraC-type DNA-binding protein n=1 Tax=Paenibacillus tianmuensis TaxID=624147 RepID=A0A1G4QA33_9BACL|nr:AraC family transcriptional regulator [Paenibacillus tianmuensis]SCW41352.1 AraC-type DNA-binding protein [Paenibacillus tianmuensis]